MPRPIPFSRHARQRMILHGISARDADGAIKKGTKRTQDGRIVASYLYFEVVYVARGEDIWVITVKPRW